MWSLAVSGRGVTTGRYEAPRFNALAKLMRPGDVVWDIGAHYGYATLIAARIVGPGGAVFAFEPSEANRWYLRHHLNWNREDAVQIVPAAVSDSDRTQNFGGKGSSVSLRLGGGEESVVVRSVASLLEEGVPAPSFLKIDVEGAEDDVLAGAMPAREAAGAGSTLPTILVAVHGEEHYRACRDQLMALDYLVVESRPIQEFNRGGRWRGDPDLLALPRNRESEVPELRMMDLFSTGA